jgi:hypothetical protein
MNPQLALRYKMHFALRALMPNFTLNLINERANEGKDVGPAQISPEMSFSWQRRMRCQTRPGRKCVLVAGNSDSVQNRDLLAHGVEIATDVIGVRPVGRSLR